MRVNLHFFLYGCSVLFPKEKRDGKRVTNSAFCFVGLGTDDLIFSSHLFKTQPTLRYRFVFCAFSAPALFTGQDQPDDDGDYSPKLYDGDWLG